MRLLFLETFEYSRPSLFVRGSAFLDRHLCTALGLIDPCGPVTLILLRRVTPTGLLRTRALISTSTHDLEGGRRRFFQRYYLGDTGFGNARLGPDHHRNRLGVRVDGQAVVLSASMDQKSLVRTRWRIRASSPRRVPAFAQKRIKVLAELEHEQTVLGAVQRLDNSRVRLVARTCLGCKSRGGSSE